MARFDKQVKKFPDNAELKAKIEQAQRPDQAPPGGAQGHLRYEPPVTQDANGYTSSTPVTDGKFVYAIFGTGVVVCYDVDGNRKWAVMSERPTQEWGHSASPVLADGKLLVHVRALIGLDAATGKPLWPTPCGQRWGTEVLTRIGGVTVVVTPAGDIVRVDNGLRLAKGIGNVEFCSPIVQDGIAYFIQFGGKAVRLPAKAVEDAKVQTLWDTNPKQKDKRFYSSPAYLDGLIYAINEEAVFSVIDAADGSVVYDKKIDFGGGTIYPSVCVAGGNVFLSSESGMTVILKPGRQYEELARNRVETFRTSLVFEGKRLYIRTVKNMYCLGG